MYTLVNWFIIGSGNGLSPLWHQVTTLTNDDSLVIRSLGPNVCEICIQTYQLSYRNVNVKMPSAKWLPICLALIIQEHIRLRQQQQMQNLGPFY